MKRVLIVDDDPVFIRLNRNAIEKNIDTEGYQILEFQDPEDALEEILKGDLPEFIFLDIKMPNMDAWELLQILEEEKGSLDLATNIVFVTDSILPADKEKALAIPCVSHYISKPMDNFSIRSIFGVEPMTETS